MSDLKLFRIEDGLATEVPGAAMPLERPLQLLIERNMEALFGVRFLASEYSTGARHGGRIDSLGLDENSSPVIFEYKRASNQTVINQGLFYLDWLMDHRAEFQILTMKQLGLETSESIDWTNPRLICVAADFTRYDEHAVLQINRSIELVRYRDYESRHLVLELLASTTAKATAAGAVQEATQPGDQGGTGRNTSRSGYKTVTELHAQASREIRELFAVLEDFILNLGDDVAKKVTSYYYAYRRLKNFACVEVHPQSGRILLYAKVDLASVQLEQGFTRDVSKIGHFGTGNLEISIASRDDVDRAKHFIATSYEAN